MKYFRGATGAIRDATYQGQRVYVIPVVALVETVIHAMGASAPEFVPLKVLNTAPDRWNSLPVTKGHPMSGDTPISANNPGVLDAYGIGTIFRSRVEGSKLCLDAYIDPRKAERLGAHDLLARLRSGEVVPVSVGAHVTVEPISGVYASKPYSGVWRSLVPNHIAILSDTDGACSMSEGCGTRSAAHHGDQCIRSACRLLTRLGEDAPPLTSIRVCALTDAYAKCERGAISVDPSSPMYVAAMRGDLLPLAMLLHHEDRHAKYGDDETAAFASSLSFLQRHNGDPALIAEVRSHLSNTFTKG